MYNFTVLIPHKLAYEVVWGHYTPREVAAVIGDFVEFFDTCEAEDGILLVNLTQLKSIPSNLLELRKDTEPFFRHPAYKVVVAYGSTNNGILTFLINSLGGMFKKPIKLFATEAEALNYIKKQFPYLAEELAEAFDGLETMNS